MEILAKTQIDAAVPPFLDGPLRALGLHQQTPRRWVEPGDLEIRRVFELQHARGAALEPRWGVALAFVPHIAAGKVGWHRTAKSAILDVLNDLRAFPVDPYVSFLRGEAAFQDELHRVVPLALQSAQLDWAETSTLDGVVRALRRFQVNRAPGLGFSNFTQPPLALAFALARLGQLAEASAELETYISSLPASCGDHLRTALRDAA